MPATTYLTVAEVAKLLNVSRMTITRLVRAGTLTAPVKLGKSASSSVRFDPDVLKADLAKLTSA
jgi:excisionase family DNA binding protein